MPSLIQIADLNKQGWVLYYSNRCGYCHAVKKRVGRVKWAAMNKVECSKGGCPRDITGYPTWRNSKTGALWSGEGVFR